MKKFLKIIGSLFFIILVLAVFSYFYPGLYIKSLIAIQWDNKIVASQPTLRNITNAQMYTTRSSFGDLRFGLPWINPVEKSGQTSKSFELGNKKLIFTNKTAFQNIFPNSTQNDQDLTSNAKVFEVMMNTTPASVGIFDNRQSAIEKMVLLSLKEVDMLSPAKYYYRLPAYTIYQSGAPDQDHILEIVIFDHNPAHDGYDVVGSNLSQAEIDTFISSLSQLN